MNFSELPPDPEPHDRLIGQFGTRKMSLRHFVIATVAAGMGMFVWYRTGGDLLLCLLVATMTGAVVDVRVSDVRSR